MRTERALSNNSPSISGHLPWYVAALERGDSLGAIEIALDLLERGAEAERLITELLAAAQREVGQQWLRGRWSIATEHGASAIAESALQVIADTAMRAPGAVAEGSAGRAVIACGADERHALPGHMASQVLRLRGADVTFIGPSVAVHDIADLLGEEPPRVVAVSCSMPTSLTGAWSTISALRAVGMTVICGGRGFGANGAWGLALGADLWAADFSRGADLVLINMHGPRALPREPAGTPQRIEEARILERDHDGLVEAAYARALDAWPRLRDSDAGMKATRDDLSHTLRTVASAALVGDNAIITEYVAWYENVLSARALPLAFVPTAFTLLLSILPANLPNARAAATAALDACTALTMSAS